MKFERTDKNSTEFNVMQEPLPIGIKKTEEVMTMAENDIYQVIADAINDERATISKYTVMIDFLKNNDNPHYEMIPIIEDIIKEEHTHIGQLRAIQKLVDKGASYEKEGEKEAIQQLNTANVPNSTPMSFVSTTPKADEIVTHMITPTPTYPSMPQVSPNSVIAKTIYGEDNKAKEAEYDSSAKDIDHDDDF